MSCKKLLIFVCASLIAGAASSQVHRCKDATGRTNYTDAPCSGSQNGQLILRAPTREEILEERLRVAENNERQARVRAEIAERSSYARGSQDQNVNINFRDNTPDKSKSSECLGAKKELDYVSSIQTLAPDVKRSRMNAASTNVHVSCR